MRRERLLLEFLRDQHRLSLQISLAPGVRLEGLGENWVAFSALSGETHQVNHEAAAILEWLAPGPMSEAALCAALADEAGVDAAEIGATLRHVWPALETAGLIRTASDPHRA